MMRSIKSILSTDRERYKVPRKVQDVIPIRRIWPDGIFLVGNKFVKSWKFTDINYLVASREDKERMFLTYSELLNSLDSGATTKITVNNHHQRRSRLRPHQIRRLAGALCEPLPEGYQALSAHDHQAR